MVERDPGARPAPHSRARRRECAGAQGDDVAFAVRRRVASVGREDAPPAGGRVAGGRDVAAEADEHSTAADGPSRRIRGEVGGERLAGRTEVELDARAKPDRSVRSIEADGAPAGDRLEADLERFALGRDPTEVVVVAERAQRGAYGRVDGTVGGERSVQGRADRPREERPDPDLSARVGVEMRQLAVPEPAVCRIDLVENPRDRAPGGVGA